MRKTYVSMTHITNYCPSRVFNTSDFYLVISSSSLTVVEVLPEFEIFSLGQGSFYSSHIFPINDIYLLNGKHR